MKGSKRAVQLESITVPIHSFRILSRRTPIMPKASEAWRRMDGCVCNGLLQALIFHFSHLTKQSQAAVVADFPALAADATITSYKKY